MRASAARLATAAALVLCSAATAYAQDAEWPEKIWISVSGGVQAGSARLSDSFSVPQFAEDEAIAVGYLSKAGSLVAASGGYRIWRRMGVAIAVTRASSRGSVSVDAQIPHPFFFKQPRHVQGTTSASRTEVAADIMVAWLMPLSDRVRMIVSAGPSIVSVSQSAVTGVVFSQEYPYDAAAFTGTTSERLKKTGPGVSASADVFWMFSSRIGAGALLQVTHASVRTSRGTGTPADVKLIAGGAQVAAGLRMVF